MTDVVIRVGFDLDMTLIDSRPGIAATYRELSARTGVPIDADLVVSRLGPPLAHEMVHWFPPERVAEAVDAYRTLYPEYAIAACRRLPGAAGSLAAVRAHGGLAYVITAKTQAHAQLHLDHLDLHPDELIGDVWAEGKRAALRSRSVDVYVGDHTADMAAARGAGALAVGVTTGPCPADELRTAGAHVVLADLTGFPAWLDAHIGPIPVGTAAPGD